MRLLKQKKFLNFLVKPSTLQFIKIGRQTDGYSILDWIHGYIYMRWPYLYIRIATGEVPFVSVFRKFAQIFETIFIHRFDQRFVSEQEENLKLESDDDLKNIRFADSYHGKVVPLESAEELVVLNREIELRHLEQIIPYRLAQDIVLKNPDHIVTLDCPCRAARKNPCKPLDVCLIIGEPFAGFIADHHSNRSRWISSKEAIQILRDEDKRGHVHHAFFKDAMLGRFYAICNCCSCCCGAIQAHRHGIPMLASSGYVISLDSQKCCSCGQCVEYCQFGALNLKNDCLVIRKELCMGCGVCLSHCENDALFLDREQEQSKPLEMNRLLKEIGTNS